MIPSRVCAAVLVALLAGCGSDSDPSDPSTLPDSPADTDVVPAPGDAGSPSTPVTAAPVDTGSPSPGAAALITSDTYETILRSVVAITNDETLDAASLRVRPVLDGFADRVQRVIDTGAASEDDGLAFTSFESLHDDGVSGNYTFSCGNGGSVTVRSYDGASAGGPFITRMATDGTCTIGDDAYEGSADMGLPFSVRAPDTDTFERFSIVRADGDSLALDGEYFTEFDEVGVFFEHGWNGASLASVDAGETTRVEDYTSLRRSVAPSELVVGEPPSVAANITFSVTAPWSSNETLDVTVDLAHADPELSRNDAGGAYPAQWSAGTLRIAAPDGSGLTLSPETGDPATFSVTFDGEDGEPIVRDWADGFQVRCSALFDCG